MNSNNAIERLRGSNSANALELSLTRRLAVQKQSGVKVLLLDISSSMNAMDYTTRSTRIDKLWDIVQQLRAEGLSFQVAVFNHNVSWSDAISRPEPNGGTILDKAFIWLASQNVPQLHSITLIHDGEPSNPDNSINAAVALGVPVNVLFVGDNSDKHSVKFAQALASVTKGQFAEADINAVASQLAIAENAVRGFLMLTDGSESGHGPIAL